MLNRASRLTSHTAAPRPASDSPRAMPELTPKQSRSPQAPQMPTQWSPPLTGKPGNISGIATSFNRLDSPNANAQPTKPLTKRQHARLPPESPPEYAPRVAPNAFRSPISRVRSDTVTSMMFITPMPPSDSVTSAINPRKTVIESKIRPPVAGPQRCPTFRSRSYRAGSKPWARADHSLHLCPPPSHHRSSDRGWYRISYRLPGTCKSFGRHIARHRRVRDKDLFLVQPRVAAVLRPSSPRRRRSGREGN